MTTTYALVTVDERGHLTPESTVSVGEWTWPVPERAEAGGVLWMARVVQVLREHGVKVLGEPRRSADPGIREVPVRLDEAAAPTVERLDIEACEENLNHYARADDARSCRDIGLALARELTAVRERADSLGDLAEWLVARAELLPEVTTTAAETMLAEAIIRAEKALGRTEEG